MGHSDAKTFSLPDISQGLMGCTDRVNEIAAELRSLDLNRGHFALLLSTLECKADERDKKRIDERGWDSVSDILCDAVTRAERVEFLDIDEVKNDMFRDADMDAKESRKRGQS